MIALATALRGAGPDGPSIPVMADQPIVSNRNTIEIMLDSHPVPFPTSRQRMDEIADMLGLEIRPGYRLAYVYGDRYQQLIYADDLRSDQPLVTASLGYGQVIAIARVDPDALLGSINEAMLLFDRVCRYKSLDLQLCR